MFNLPSDKKYRVCPKGKNPSDEFCKISAFDEAEAVEKFAKKMHNNKLFTSDIMDFEVYLEGDINTCLICYTMHKKEYTPTFRFIKEYKKEEEWNKKPKI